MWRSSPQESNFVHPSSITRTVPTTAGPLRSGTAIKAGNNYQLCNPTLSVLCGGTTGGILFNPIFSSSDTAWLPFWLLQIPLLSCSLTVDSITVSAPHSIPSVQSLEHIRFPMSALFLGVFSFEPLLPILKYMVHLSDAADLPVYQVNRKFMNAKTRKYGLLTLWR